MSDPVTVVIPVERGAEWNRDRATSVPEGTPILIAEHDPGEWADAVNKGVAAAETDLVVVSAQDAWFKREPDSVEFLADLAWDCDVTWGPLFVHREDRVGTACEGAFCPNRLTRENYINPVACYRKTSFLDAGGVTSGLWDTNLRILKAGGRFKYVPEAAVARDGVWDDTSPIPDPVDVLATFYHQATIGTTYWRCQLPARWLPGQTMFNIPAMGQGEDDNLVFLNHAGAAVFQYAGDQAHHAIVQAMQQQGIRVLIEVDDDYTHWHKKVMTKAGWFKTAEAAADTMGYSVEVHRETCKIADGIIVTTERLAKQYRRLNEDVFICPNQIDPADWPELVKPDDGVFRIGWFASGSHNDDIGIIAKALEWASEQPNVEVHLIGQGLLKSGQPIYKFPFLFRPWSNDLGVYKRFLLSLNVGLAPVTGNPWAQCRSDLKALEYAMAGAVPIVSDVAPYEGTEVPGIIHCPDSKAFLGAVKWCVENQDEVRDLAKEARAYVLDERTVEANIDTWKEAICPTNA